MNRYNAQNPSVHMKRNREAYSDFLPEFRALIELGNWSQDVEKSIGIIKAVKKEYKRTHTDKTHLFHDSLRQVHEDLWLQSPPAGKTGVYRLTTQYLKPAVYRVTFSCDDDSSEVYFSQTKDVFDNSNNLENIAKTIVRGVISMFKDD